MKSLQDNEYIDSVSRGKLWNLCENLLAITAECEKVFRQHSAGLVHEIPLQQVMADILQKPKVSSLHGMLSYLMLVWLKARHL